MFTFVLFLEFVRHFLYSPYYRYTQDILLLLSPGQTALHCAILAHGKAKRNSQERIDSTEIIKTLIKAGADPSAQVQNFPASVTFCEM